MNLFKKLIQSAPVKERLVFGFNNNIIINSVDTEVRKRNGMAINANTFIKYSQVDPETKKIIANSEFPFWNIDSTSDFVISNFDEQLSCMMGILTAAIGDAASDTFAEAIEEVLGRTEIEEGEDEVEVTLGTKAGSKELQETMMNTFADLMKDHIGVDKCPLLKCKLISNKKGFLDIAKVETWILPMDSEFELPVVTDYEQKIFDDAMKADDSKQAKPDAKGKKKKDDKAEDGEEADAAKEPKEKPDNVKGERKVSKKNFRAL